jgi:hypothetical protein
MMECKKRKRLMIVCAWALVWATSPAAGCEVFKSEPAPSPSPLDTANKILKLHGLLGKQPDERPDRVQKAAPDRGALKQLFLDYDKEDPFLADLYVGFVVGALSVNQRNLHVFQESRRAEVKAGNARISMHLVGGVWRVSLSESIPVEIRARAKMEKLKVAENTRQ